MSVDPIAQMVAGRHEPDLTDPDNPEWTEADFARATPAEDLPPEVLAAFPKSKGGRPKALAPKQQVTLRLSPDVLDHYRAMGKGWQTQMERDLRDVILDRAKAKAIEGYRAEAKVMGKAASAAASQMAKKIGQEASRFMDVPAGRAKPAYGSMLKKR